MNIETNSSLILGVLLAYFLGIIALGTFYSRKAKSSKDFILAGHSLSTPFVTASVVATWLGGAVILGGSTEAFNGGLQAVIWDPFSPALTLLISGFLFVSIFRRSRFVTSIDFYNARFDKRVAMAGLIVSLFAYVSWIAAQLLSLGVIISVVSGLETVSATLLGALVILTISLTGGLWALSRSDMLAFVILTFVLLMVVPYAFDAVGGPQAFIEKAGNAKGVPPFSLFYTNEVTTGGRPAGFNGYLGLLGIFYMTAAWISVALGDLGGSVLTARALAAKNESAAARGFVYGGFTYLALGLVPVFVGMCVFILKADFPEVDRDDVFPWFVQSYLPEWMVVMFFLAVSSAIISTAGDTILTAGALIGYTTLRAVKPSTNDRQHLLATRIAMVVFAFAGLLFSLAMGDLYNLLVFAGAIAFPVLAPTFISGVLWEKTNVTGAIASIATGAVSWLVMIVVLYPYTGNEIWDAIYIASVPAFLCSLTVIIAVSLLTQTSCPPNPIQDVDGNKISDTKRFTW